MLMTNTKLQMAFRSNYAVLHASGQKASCSGAVFLKVIEGLRRITFGMSLVGVHLSITAQSSLHVLYLKVQATMPGERSLLGLLTSLR